MLPLLAHAGEHVRRGVEVTLLSDRPDLWYSGMTPEWTGGVYTRDDVTVSLERICAEQGVRFVQGKAVGLERRARVVTAQDGRRLGYDLVAFDVGAVNPLSERAGGAVHTKPLHQIEALGAFLEAPGPRRLVVVGGGAAGVETALNVTARPDARDLHVVVVEPSGQLMKTLPERAGGWALQTLRQRGAEVRLETAVSHVSEGAVHLEGGGALAADAVLWATGSVGPDLFARSGLATTDDGFVRVRRGLWAVGDPRVFAAGDAAAVEGHEGLARIGVHAVKQGPVLRENVGRVVDAVLGGRPLSEVSLRPFRPYPAAPLVLSTGEPVGWYAVGPVALKGRPFLRLKHALDRRWIDPYRPPDSYAAHWDARAASDGPGRR
jgi:NADH dehydrogenase FAD-containing subunit